MLRKLFSITLLNQYKYDGSTLDPLDSCYKEFKFRELVSDDFSKNAVFEIKNRKERYLNHSENGHRCFGFENANGDIVSYFWLTCGDKDRPHSTPIFRGSPWLLTNGEACIWDCRTIEAYCRQGLYREGIRRLVSFCQQQNIMNIMMSCHVSNSASHAGILSAGFTCTGTVRCIVIGRLKLVWCKKKMPKISRLLSPLTTSDVFPGYP